MYFSNYASEKSDVPIVRAACEKAGIKLEIIGSGAGRQCDATQEILGDYDLVFAKARCALEALATGCAVILCDLSTLGSMVRFDDLEVLRDLNFGVRARTLPLRANLIADQIAQYNAEDAMQVSAWVHERAGLEAAMDGLEEIYREALSEYSGWNISTPEWQQNEARASADYLRWISLRWQEVEGWRIDRNAVRESRDAIQLECAALRADRDQMQNAQQKWKDELKTARDELHAVKQDRNALKIDRDSMRENRNAIEKNRDDLRQDRDALRENRDAIQKHRDELKVNRDILKTERDLARNELEAEQQIRRDLENSRAVRWSRKLKNFLQIEKLSAAKFAATSPRITEKSGFLA